MGFFDEVKKKMDELDPKKKGYATKKDTKQPKKGIAHKMLAEETDKLKVQLEELLLEGEILSNIYGIGFGFIGVTDKRIFIGDNFASDSKPNKVISFIPLNKITGVEYEYEWSLIIKKYNVNVQVSSKKYKIEFVNKETAQELHKILSQKLLEI